MTSARGPTGPPLARAEAPALADARFTHARGEISLILQWIAAEQWEAKRLSWPVKVFGDFRS
jgi:hypothetical protein